MAEALPLLREYNAAVRADRSGSCSDWSDPRSDIRELEADMAAGLRVKSVVHCASRFLEVGGMVQIHSLQAKPELNGCFAELISRLQANGRYEVRIKGNAEHARKKLSVKPANLRANLGML